jgi:Peptidase family M48
MDYVLLSCLALAVLLAINLLTSLFAAALWYCLSKRANGWPAAVRTKVLFMLRLLPAAAALVSVVIFFIPSYVLYEPNPADEVVGPRLAVIASVSAAGIAIAVWKGFASARATRQLVADWIRHAEPIAIAGRGKRAFCLRHPFPLMAIVGVFRPRLFVSQCVLESLDPKELLAALEHEAGHLAARDNLKRILMRTCRDLLPILPWGRSLDRGWGRAAEAMADEYAARRGAPVALDLASALVKVARMVPDGIRPTMPAGALLVGEDADEISWRVLRLTQIAEKGHAFDERVDLILSAAIWGSLFFLLITVAYFTVSPHFLERLHAAMEQVFPLIS